MNCWKVLNIPEESDILTIETAYNNLLMTMDENRENYDTIKKAYDDAIEYNFEHAFDNLIKNNYENTYNDDNYNLESYSYAEDFSLDNNDPYKKIKNEKKIYSSEDDVNKKKSFSIVKIIAALWFIAVPIWNLVSEFFEDTSSEYTYYTEHEDSYNKDGIFIDIDGIEKRNIYTDFDFEQSEFYGPHYMYLSDIIPLDLYLIQDNGDYRFENKEYINSWNIDDDSYTQMYCGNLENIKIVFIDSNFSMDFIDEHDNGYYIEGYKYYFNDDEMNKLKAEAGYDLDNSEVSRYFLEKN